MAHRTKNGENMANLTIGQAVRNAIEAENASMEFYQSLKEYTEDESTKQFFQEMAQLEMEHIQQIKSAWKAIEENGDLPLNADREVDFIETVPIWKDAQDISFDEALILARDAENQAVLYYDALADTFAGELQKLFQLLAKQEESHAKMLSGRIDQEAHR